MNTVDRVKPLIDSDLFISEQVTCPARAVRGRASKCAGVLATPIRVVLVTTAPDSHGETNFVPSSGGSSRPSGFDTRSVEARLAYTQQDSRSFRCEWLLQELGAEHELVYSKRHANRAAEEFRTAHAMGKAPMLVLEDGKTIITESGAICEYIIDVYATQEQKAQFYAGNDPSQRARVRSWSYFAEGTLLTHAIVRRLLLLERCWPKY